MARWLAGMQSPPAAWAHAQYYEERPRLAEYTAKTEVARMQYSATDPPCSAILIKFCNRARPRPRLKR